jgi:hypothetical protein
MQISNKSVNNCKESATKYFVAPSAPRTPRC